MSRVMVLLVGGVWAEVKPLAVEVVEPGDDAQPTITDLTYGSRMVDAQQFQIATIYPWQRYPPKRSSAAKS